MKFLEKINFEKLLEDGYLRIRAKDCFIDEELVIHYNPKTKNIICKDDNQNIGIAKCHPDDTFDVKIGGMLAVTRCVKDVYQDYLNGTYDAVESYMRRYNRDMERDVKKLNQLVGRIETFNIRHNMNKHSQKENYQLPRISLKKLELRRK